MTFNSNISERKAYLQRAKQVAKPKIETVIKLYAETKVPNYKSALSVVVKLSQSVLFKVSVAEKAYIQCIANYENATPPTGRITRQIQRRNDQVDNVEVIDVDVSMARTLCTLKSINTEHIESRRRPQRVQSDDRNSQDQDQLMSRKGSGATYINDNKDAVVQHIREENIRD